MKNRSISMAAVAGAVMLASSFAIGAAGAQQPDHCLNNDDAYIVDVGVQYTDTNGTWVCAPGSASASAGGWIKLNARANNTVPATVTTNPNPVTNGAKGHAGIGVPALSPLLAYIAVAGVIVAVIGVLIIVRLRSAPRLTGTVHLEEVGRGQR